MKSTNNSGGTPANLYPNWFERNWRKVLLLTVTAGGVFAMAFYKISVADDSELLPIVIFTEVAAGVAVFAQALLRRIDKKAADRAFTFSIWARAAMAVIGVALFAEAATFPEADNVLGWVIKPGAVTWTGFLTYEVGNGLMLLIEWMFSHLLTDEDYDARAQVVKLQGALEEAEQERDEYRGSAEDSDAIIEEVRKLLAPHLGDAPVRTEGVGAQLRFFVEDRGQAVGAAEQRANVQRQIAEQVPVLHALLQAAHGGNTGRIRALADANPELDSAHPELLEIIGSLAGAQAVRSELLGKVFTCGTNRQAFYCVSCEKRTEIGRGKPKKCKHCQTIQPQVK